MLAKVKCVALGVLIASSSAVANQEHSQGSSKKELVRKVDKEGTVRYYNAKGQYHRDNGPAVEYADGHKAWYQNGKMHRDDGPAVEGSDGRKTWYKNGKLHRDDGPDVEFPNGTKYWHKDGKLGTMETVDQDGNKHWYKDGKLVMRKTIDQDGTIKYYNANGRLHREDGPAVEGSDGLKEWRQDGRLYRDHGPAIEYDTRTKYDEPSPLG